MTGGQLPLHVLFDPMDRHMTWALDHDLHVVLPRDLSQCAQSFQLAELSLVVGVGQAARPQPVAQREGDVVLLGHFADPLEVRVEEILLLVAEAPLGHDRAPAGHDSGHALGGERHVPQQQPGVDGEVVHALLGLLDDGVEKHVDGQVVDPAPHFLQTLVNGYRADGHRRVADDPLARLVDVGASGQIHHGVRAPAGRPLQLLHLFLDRRGQRRVADVGVDFHQEVAADGHRFQLGVADVGREDRAAGGDLVAYERWREVLPQGHEAHLFGDLAAAGAMHLGKVHIAVARAARGPGRTQLGQTLAWIVALRPGGVVDAHRRLPARQRDLAHGHA